MAGNGCGIGSEYKMRDYNEPDIKDVAFEIKKIWEAISALQLAMLNKVDPNIIIPMWGEYEDD